jgi:hypothetical protein
MSEVNRADEKPVKNYESKRDRSLGNKVVESRIMLKRISEKSYEAVNWFPLASLGVTEKQITEPCEEFLKSISTK